MVVVAIIGVLAAVAIPAFSRYIRKSRSAEVPNDLGKLWAGVVAYYHADHSDQNGTTLPKQVPFWSGGMVYGYEDFYQPSPGHCGCLPGAKCAGGGDYWNTDIIFSALRFAKADPHAYVSSYDSVGSTGPFTITDNGDLDCDGTLSAFIRTGTISASGEVTGSVAAHVVNENE